MLHIAYFCSRHLALNLPLAKLYTNSLMSSLNSRAGWKFTSGDTDDGRPSGGPAKVRHPPRLLPFRSLTQRCPRLQSAAMPEFLHLSTTHIGTRPEVLESRALPSREDLEADIGAQVMVTVESHEMRDIDAEDTDQDHKWADTQSTGGREDAGYKPREMV